jgi:hypothetical protein
MTKLASVATLFAALNGSGCGSDEENKPCFNEVLHDHRMELQACEAGDVCILPPPSGCYCFFPLNSNQQELFDTLRSESTCGGECGTADCIRRENPRCVEGMCVASEVGAIDAGVDAGK